MDGMFCRTEGIGYSLRVLSRLIIDDIGALCVYSMSFCVVSIPYPGRCGYEQSIIKDKIYQTCEAIDHRVYICVH
jgi:hypothetical protein